MAMPLKVPGCRSGKVRELPVIILIAVGVMLGLGGTIVISGAQESESWKQKAQSVSFNDLKNAVADTLAQLGISNFSLKKADQKWMSNCVEIVAQNGEMVEHDAVLFRVRPE